LGCKTSSYINESYFDLSLSIPERFLTKKNNSQINRKQNRKLKKKYDKNERPENNEEQIDQKELINLFHSSFIDIRNPLLNLSECSLLSCFHTFTEPELLFNENAYKCLECTKRKMVYLIYLPSLLIN
jgi:hypothetical protein